MFKYSTTNKFMINGLANLNKNNNLIYKSTISNTTRSSSSSSSINLIYKNYTTTANPINNEQKPKSARQQAKDLKISKYNALFNTKWANTKIRPQEELEHYKNILLSEKKDIISHNPFDHFFLKKGWLPTLAYIPLKIISFFRSLKPLNKNKLNIILKDNFIKLMAAIQNNDIETMSGMKYDQSHFMMETSRDLFHTFKEMGFNFADESSYLSVEPIILKLEPILPNFDALVAYYITISTPTDSNNSNSTKKKEKYIACILWRGTFPPLAPGEKSPDYNLDVKKIDFESKLTWRVGKIFVPAELKDVQSERAIKRLKKSMEENNKKK